MNRSIFDGIENGFIFKIVFFLLNADTSCLCVQGIDHESELDKVPDKSTYVQVKVLKNTDKNT